MKEYEGFQDAYDPTCGIDCECGYLTSLWVSDSEIVRCPNCGRGYKNEFVTWQYEKDEDDRQSTT